MKAVGYRQHGLPISDPRALEDLNLPDPSPPAGRDLLVRVHAVSVTQDTDGTYSLLDADQPLATQQGKPLTVQRLQLRTPVAMVGDGSTDAAVRGVVDSFFAYTRVARREQVVAVADAEAPSFDALRELLFAPS